MSADQRTALVLIFIGAGWLIGCVIAVTAMHLNERAAARRARRQDARRRRRRRRRRLPT